MTVESAKSRRILDAAEALLLRTGYRKVAMAEVADRAGVGKGTPYLYWPSKAELFGAVLIRESIRRLDEQIKALRADPAECQLHRTMRTLFQQVHRSPLAMALYTRDQDVLGELVTTSQSGGAFLTGKIDTTARYLDLLHRHGLLADDPAADPLLSYRLSAVAAGTFVLEGLPGATTDIDVTAKADAFATTLRRAFEPTRAPTPATLRAATAELIALYNSWRTDLATALTTPARPPRPDHRDLITPPLTTPDATTAPRTAPDAPPARPPLHGPPRPLTAPTESRHPWP